MKSNLIKFLLEASEAKKENQDKLVAGIAQQFPERTLVLPPAIKLGIPQVDRALSDTTLLEIQGKSGSGKTSICKKIAQKAAGSVLYVSTSKASSLHFAHSLVGVI